MATARSAPANLCRGLGIRYPIIQDGLGTYGTAALAAAVSSAGGLGSVSIRGLALDPAVARSRLRAELDAAAGRTDRPFAVTIPVGVDRTGAVLAITDPYVGAALEARRDPAMAARLVACTTSAGFSEPHSHRILDAGMVHLHKVGPSATPARQPRPASTWASPPAPRWAATPTSARCTRWSWRRR